MDNLGTFKEAQMRQATRDARFAPETDWHVERLRKTPIPYHVGQYTRARHACVLTGW